MNTITAMNLGTEESRVYQVNCPSEAVMWAWLADNGRKNTWEYPRLYAENYRKLTWGEKTVTMGDWCAALDQGGDCETK